MKITHENVYRNLATLLNAGLDVKKALRSSVAKEKGALHDAILLAANAIDRGATLTRALARQPEIFPQSDRSVIEIGESTGHLSEAFKALADWYQTRAQIWRIFRSGLIRPVLSIHLAAFILPLQKLFSGAGWAGYLLSVFSFLIIFYVPTATIVLLYRWSGKQGDFRAFIDKALSLVPILGRALQDIALGRYCFGFWTLFSSGIPMQKSAEMAAELSGNTLVSEMVRGGGASVRKGQPISNGFSREIPHDFRALWSVGEESGRLEETVQRLYKKHVEQGEFLLKEFFRWLPRIIGALAFLLILYFFLSDAVVLSDRGQH